MKDIRSLTGKRWALAPLHGREGMPEHDALALVELLRQSRGLVENATQEENWHNPALYPDAAKAAERVKRAVERGEHIAVFGDYDCDGVTATAQIVRALRRRGVQPVIRLPHRVHDGYGLKPVHIQELTAAGVQLLITVDTGVSAHEAIDAANAAGIDVIVLDHHHVLTPPAAYAILHPALAPHFPQPFPAAAGVVFTFLHALEGDMWEDRDTDLVFAMFGTVADLVLLKGHNRILVREGLAALRRLPPSPVRLLTDQLSAGKPLTSVDIAFRIAPRINAAGRMADPMLALRALLEGGELLQDLETLNSLRQDQTARALDRALLELHPGPDGELPPFLSIASASYPHGILGLLAGKLTEKYGRPSMAVHIDGALCTASLRSPAGFNIVEAIGRRSDLLISFGGHAQAAGATFNLEHYVTLCAALEQDTRSRMSVEHLTPTLMVDAILPAHAVTQDFCMHLTGLEPFGQGNPEPLFLVENITLQNPRRVGGEGRHLQAHIQHCKMIGFGLGSLLEDARGPVDILCRAGIDTWNGRITPQLFVVDMRDAHTADITPKATALGAHL